ncbi:hypothetical protein Taro_040974, partial [Colocasia esculenta]|nr:hypothetical protein [Colocasia esculenta]
ISRLESREDVTEVPSYGVLEKLIEYIASYVYHSLFAYFDRNNVALKGLAENRNECGGRVKLLSILLPLSEFDHDEKGDALYGVWHFVQMLLHEVDAA